MTDFEKVKEFHEATGGVVRPYVVSVLPREEEALRFKLILEELDELVEATDKCDPVATADAIGDLIYVLHGMALHYGFDMDKVMAEIHRSNMTKVDPILGVRKREDGKILKPATYEEPDIATVLDWHEPIYEAWWKG